MRYSAHLTRLEIIRLVELTPLPALTHVAGETRHSQIVLLPLVLIAISGADQKGLADRPSRPDWVWNSIPEAIRNQIVDLALDQPELSPRELAVRFTDEQEYFVSEASALSA